MNLIRIICGSNRYVWSLIDSTVVIFFYWIIMYVLVVKYQIFYPSNFEECSYCRISTTCICNKLIKSSEHGEQKIIKQTTLLRSYALRIWSSVLLNGKKGKLTEKYCWFKDDSAPPSARPSDRSQTKRKEKKRTFHREMQIIFIFAVNTFAFSMFSCMI